MNPLLEVIRQLVDAAGRTQAFTTEKEFYLLLVQRPYDPLEIRSRRAEHSYLGETRHISIAHLASYPGQQTADTDPELCMTEHGIPIELHHHQRVSHVLTIVASGTFVHRNVRQLTEHFMAEWAQNIKAQNWLSIAAAMNPNTPSVLSEAKETEHEH